MARLSLIPSRPRVVAQTAEQETPRSSGTRIPQYSAPIIVDLISAVTMEAPDATMEIETQVCQATTVKLAVKNLLMSPTRVALTLQTSRIVDENGKPLSQAKALPQQMMALISNPGDTVQMEFDRESPVANLLKGHQTFLTNCTTLEFRTAEGTESIDLDFAPIMLGTFRCLILFQNADVGEFVHEIIGKSTMPQSLEVSSSKFRCEAGKKISVPLAIDIMNPQLTRTLAYSIERANYFKAPTNERKFKDSLARKIHEIEIQYKQSFVSSKLTLMCSAPQFFDLPPDFNLAKPLPGGPDSPAKGNQLLVTFKPPKAGEYPCKIIFMRGSDIRCFHIRGIGIPATRELSLEFSVAAGKSVRQDIPFVNPSDETWNHKVTLTGDSGFSAPARLTVKPNSTATLQVSFNATRVGTVVGEMVVVNQSRESTTIYKLSATVDEPLAEGKLNFECQARQPVTKTVEFRSFVRNAEINVTTTVPLIEFRTPIHIVDGAPTEPFTFTLNAPRSGLLAGIISFTDPASKNYIWYVVEIRVDLPPPEEVLTVTTIARRSVVVHIPINNPKTYPVKFFVTIADTDINGSKEVTIDPGSSFNYPLFITPMKSGKRATSVYFYSDDDSEFWYSLRIEVEDPPENILAPVTAPIGKSTSTFILLENPTKTVPTYRIENDNSTAWQVIAKRVIQIPPGEKRKIEVRYIPTAVGLKRTACLAFRSAENGDHVYRLTGTGKPPQTLSPTLVSSPVEQTKTALILFTNPFPYPSRFSMSLSGEQESGEIFKFLVKRKVFSLTSYGEEFQIPFMFSPTALGQFRTSIVVASLGPARGPLPELEALPSVRWIYPVIGNAVETAISETRILKCRAQQCLEQQLQVTLTGEQDSFAITEYTLQVEIPKGYEYLRSILDLQAVNIQKSDTASELFIRATFTPQRPLQQTVTLIVSNPLSQEWQFQIELNVELGKPLSTIVIESLLNKTGTARIQLPPGIRAQVPFHVYFAAGSASEFTLSAAHGIIDPVSPELPVDVLFAPKMYGKLLKGLLVVDTLDSQFLFEVVGKTPEYVPPVVVRSALEAPVDIREKPKRKRNIIRENIDSVKITKPRIDQK
jgi:hypothetical protein